MLRSSATDSIVFRQLTGRATPKLAHPTSTAFDLQDWLASIGDDTVVTDRDATLLRAAMVIGTNLRSLRQQHMDTLFASLSPQQVMVYAIGDANRAWALLGRKSREQRLADAEASSVVFTSGISQRKLNVGSLTPPANADDLNTAMVDTLPHWFAQALKQKGAAHQADFDYVGMGGKVQYVLSLEHALSEAWRQVLWEPWTVKEVEEGWYFSPPRDSGHELWRAWVWREQSNLLQQSFLFADIEGTRPKFISKTAIGASHDGTSWWLTVGEPSAAQSDRHRTELEVLDASYVSAFLDIPLSAAESRMTARLLALAVLALQDAGRCMVSDETDVEFQDEGQLQMLSCALPRGDLRLHLSQALDIGEELADACLERLISSPSKDLTATFRDGLWHRPLVAIPGDDRLRMVLGSLLWGSPVRRVERWLKDGNPSGDLSGTSQGLRHEALLRQRFQVALGGNDLLNGVHSPVVFLPPAKGGEEIDGLLRIGNTLLVLEIKCFIAPADPIDRHGYLVKLEEACEQANRKADWLDRDRSRIPVEVAGSEPGALRIVPLVVVNQGSGVSFRYADCVVVDASYLELYLSTGTYRSGAARDFRGEGRTAFSYHTFYVDAHSAETGIPTIFEHHPGLAPFLASVRWDFIPLPLGDGSHLLMAGASMDLDKYVTALPDPIALLSQEPE